MYVLQIRLPRWPFDSVRFMDVSATAMQTHQRLQQLRQWPWQVYYLRQNAVGQVSPAHAAHHIK